MDDLPTSLQDVTKSTYADDTSLHVQASTFLETTAKSEKVIERKHITYLKPCGLYLKFQCECFRFNIKL